jgi:hypothetical protein
MIIFSDFLLLQSGVSSGVELCSDAMPGTPLADGAVLAVATQKVVVGAEEINTGGNASKEEAEEGVDDTAQTVINLVQRHDLVEAKLDKKEYTTLQNGYWKALLAAIQKAQGVALFGSEEKIPEQKTPEQKEEYKKLQTAAVAKLKGIAKTEYDALVARFNSFKKNFPALQKFVKDEVLANFTEFEFYKSSAESATLGTCMIIPARYIGEALSPTFYFWMDGLVGEKA